MGPWESGEGTEECFGIWNSGVVFLGGVARCGLDPTARAEFQAMSDLRHQFSHWEGDIDYGYLDSTIRVPYSSYMRPVAVSAVFVPKPTLTLEVELMGGGGGAAECSGYCTADPARKYYPAERESSPYGALIALEPVARPGYFFVRWTGDGGPIYDEDGIRQTEWGRLDATEDEHDDWVTRSDIHIKMVNNEGQPSDRTLTAVFHPCIHCGWPTSTNHEDHPDYPDVGSLRGDVALEDQGIDDGFQIVSNAGDIYGCYSWTLEKIRDIGAAWHAAHNDRDMSIIGISVHGGGSNGASKSHRNGLDVDVRYIRTDGSGPIDLSKHEEFPFYDATATQELIDLFIGQGAVRIFVDRPRSGLTGVGVRNLADHSDHFHVRFSDPDGIPPDDCPICIKDCLQ